MKLYSFFGWLRFRLIDLVRGTHTLTILDELRKQQYLPAETLCKIQQEKLDALFFMARNSTDYYQQFNNYNELPVLTKDIVAENFNGIVSRTYKGKLIRKTTSGSTAEPFAYYTTKHSQSYLWAGILLSWETAGYRLGEHVAFFAGTSLVKTGWKYRLFYSMMNVDIMHASPLNDEILSNYVQRLKQDKTSIVYGYANAIAVMADYLSKRAPVQLPHLKAVVTTAELLSPNTRAAIEKAFGVKVYDQYGCNEAGVSAYECEKGKKHLINTRSYYETAPDGALISTDLSNEGFPMIKYNSHDIVEMSEEGCTCGRNFPVIKSVVGRLSDTLTDRENNVLHASFFGIVFSKDTSVKKYQLIFDHDTLILNIHTDTNADKSYYNRYLDLLKEHSSFSSYELHINEPFIVGKNGKHKEMVDNRNNS